MSDVLLWTGVAVWSAIALGILWVLYHILRLAFMATWFVIRIKRAEPRAKAMFLLRVWRDCVMVPPDLFRLTNGRVVYWPTYKPPVYDGEED